MIIIFSIGCYPIVATVWIITFTYYNHISKLINRMNNTATIAIATVTVTIINIITVYTTVTLL